MPVRRYRMLEILAIGSLIVGVVLFAIPLFASDVKVDLFGTLTSIEKLGSLGSYLSGTSGIFLTLASIVFLYISVKTSFDSMEDQKQEQIQQAKLQSLRDFEGLFIFLCNELENIKDNFPEGSEVYNKEMKRLFGRYSYEKEEQIEEYARTGDLNIQVREEKIHLNFDSLILHISHIIEQVETRIPNEFESLRPTFIRILSNKLNKEELRVLQVVCNTDLFDAVTCQNLKKLNFRFYDRNEERSQRRLDESKRSAEAWARLSRSF